VPAHAVLASSSDASQRARRGSLSTARALAARWAAAGSPARLPTAIPATSAATSGSASHAYRQLSRATKPISGMPTIHAVGAPMSAHESTVVRRSAGTHAAAASVAAVVSTAIPAPTGTCAVASSARFGAAALASEPRASNVAPATS
jgi:hypothetical protein